MNLIKACMNGLRKFSRDEGGSGTVEFVIMFPLLCWAFLATVSYFHAYRSEAIAVKTTTTLADMISRETQYINGSYLNNMRNLTGFLSNSASTPDVRVTVIRWNQNRNRYEVRWSRERGSKPTLRTSNLAQMATRLPSLDHNERAIIVETWSDYTPKFDYGIGLAAFEFENFIVTRPRFAPQLCWNSSPDADPSRARC